LKQKEEKDARKKNRKVSTEKQLSDNTMNVASFVTVGTTGDRLKIKRQRSEKAG